MRSIVELGDLMNGFLIESLGALSVRSHLTMRAVGTCRQVRQCQKSKN